MTLEFSLANLFKKNVKEAPVDVSAKNTEAEKKAEKTRVQQERDKTLNTLATVRHEKYTSDNKGGTKTERFSGLDLVFDGELAEIRLTATNKEIAKILESTAAVDTIANQIPANELLLLLISVPDTDFASMSPEELGTLLDDETQGSRFAELIKLKLAELSISKDTITLVREQVKTTKEKYDQAANEPKVEEKKNVSGVLKKVRGYFGKVPGAGKVKGLYDSIFHHQEKTQTTESPTKRRFNLKNIFRSSEPKAETVETPTVSPYKKLQELLAAANLTPAEQKIIADLQDLTHSPEGVPALLSLLVDEEALLDFKVTLMGDSADGIVKLRKQGRDISDARAGEMMSDRMGQYPYRLLTILLSNDALFSPVSLEAQLPYLAKDGEYTKEDILALREKLIPLVEQAKLAATESKAKDKKGWRERLGRANPREWSLSGVQEWLQTSPEQAKLIWDKIQKGEIHRHMLVLMVARVGVRAAVGAASGSTVLAGTAAGMLKDTATAAGLVKDSQGRTGAAGLYSGASDIAAVFNRGAGSEAEKAKYRTSAEGKWRHPIGLLKKIGGALNTFRGVGIQVGFGVTHLRSQISGDLAALEAGLAGSNQDQGEQVAMELSQDGLKSWIFEQLREGNGDVVINLGKRLALLNKLTGDYGGRDVKGAEGATFNFVRPQDDAEKLRQVHGWLQSIITGEETTGITGITEVREKWSKLASTNAEDLNKRLGLRRVAVALFLDALATGTTLGYDYWLTPMLGKGFDGAKDLLGIGDDEHVRSATGRLNDATRDARNQANGNGSAADRFAGNRVDTAYSEFRQAVPGFYPKETLGSHPNLISILNEKTDSDVSRNLAKKLYDEINKNPDGNMPFSWNALHRTTEFNGLSPAQFDRINKFADATARATAEAKKLGRPLTPDQKLIERVGLDLGTPLNAQEEVRLLQIANGH